MIFENISECFSRPSFVKSFIFNFPPTLMSHESDVFFFWCFDNLGASEFSVAWISPWPGTLIRMKKSVVCSNRRGLRTVSSTPWRIGWATDFRVARGWKPRGCCMVLDRNRRSHIHTLNLNIYRSCCDSDGFGRLYVWKDDSRPSRSTSFVSWSCR